MKATNVSPAASNLALSAAKGSQLIDALLALEAESLKFFRSAGHNSCRKLLFVRGHLSEALLLFDIRLPGLTVLLSVLLLHRRVVLLVFSHLELVSRLDQRNLLFALGTLKVVHRFGQALEFALHVLTLLDLLLDGILHEAALVELLALLELDLELFAFAALLCLGEKGKSLLLLLLLHLLANAGLLTDATFLFETFGLCSLVLALQGEASLLGFPLLLLKDELCLLFAALNDNLARESQLVLNLNLRQQFSGVGLGCKRRSRYFVRVNHLDAVAQLLSHEHKVILDAVALELIALKADALVLVVKARRDSAALRAVH